MPLASNSLTHVFAYGSNMCARRITARAATATPVMTGYVTHRRLVFHKRGRDGSAKADALYTGCESHRVWGVVYSMTRADLRTLNEYELGYEHEDVLVHGESGPQSASIYVAQAKAVDASLKPSAWYHRLVVHGAREHRLPCEYIELLETVEFIADPDDERDRLLSQLVDGRPARETRTGSWKARLRGLASRRMDDSIIVSFWPGGPVAYEEGLRKEYEALLHDLRERCEQCENLTTRGALESELRAMEAEYRSKVQNIKNLLF